MSLRRLLATAGGGYFPEPAPEVFAMTAAPKGGEVWFNQMTTVQYNGYVYKGYIRGDNGDCALVVYDEAGRTTSNEHGLHNALGADDHGAPGLLVRDSDHRLMAFYCPHDGTTMRLKITVNSLDSDPLISGGWGSASTVFTTGDVTYPTPIQLGETNDPIYLFYRDIASAPTQRLAYRKSTDGGSTWGSEVIVYAESGRSSYWRIVQTSDTRIDIGMCDGHPAVDSATSIYHFYYEGGSYFKSDGSSAGSPILDTSDLTLVQSGATKLTWIWDAAVDGSGTPHLAWVRYESGTSDLRYVWARWTGSAWDVHDIAAAGGVISAVSGSNYYAGGVALDRDDPTTVYASVATGTEMRRYRTANGGSSWTSKLLESSSKVIRPVCPINADQVRVVWMKGTYTSFTSFSTGTSGAR